MSTLRLRISRGTRRAAGAVAALACLAPPLAAQFGELPPGYVGRLAIEGIRVETGVTFLIDSATAARFVPAGLRLLTLGDVARFDTATARYLAARPHLKTAVPNALGFFAVDSFAIDDGPPLPVVGAFWWLSVQPAESLDHRARGGSNIQVAFWSPDLSSATDLRAQWPQLQDAPVTVERGEDGAWRLALPLPDGVIRGRCKPSGVRRPAGYPVPGYTTTWNPGARAVGFTVFTYYGHYLQDCDAEWTTEGPSLLATAIRNSLGDRPPWMKSSIEDGWHARAALYRR